MGKRLDLKTGFLCNNNCVFCVQADNKKSGQRSFDELKENLIDSRNRCDEVVFTGGEVTIRKDFFDLIKIAKTLGYNSIHLQTNGRMLSNMKFAKLCVLAGANNFTIAVHGHKASLHDSLTQARGSFIQTLGGVRNLKRIGVPVLINTVIVKQNYIYSEEIAKLLVGEKVKQFQLAVVHPMGNALKNYDSVVPELKEAAYYMRKGIQVGIDAGLRCMTEALPYCLMEGYHDYVAERFIPETEIRSVSGNNCELFSKERVMGAKKKFENCNVCKHNSYCEGIWKEYNVSL